MRRVLLAIAIAAGLCNAQAPVAVLNNYSPTIKGLTVGTTQCIIWQLPSAWRYVVECWVAGVPAKEDFGNIADPVVAFVGSFPTASGTFGWIVKAGGAASIDFESKCGEACGGASDLPHTHSFAWTFPAP